MTVLTKSSVDHFLANKLEFGNWAKVLEANKLDFLNKYVLHHSCKIYFHNISLSAQDPSKRRNPTVSEVIQNGTTKNGGLCIFNNYFTKLVLDFLGFDTIFVSITWNNGTGRVGTHCGVLVNLNGNEKYFIDVGSGMPLWEPVPLNKLPYRKDPSGKGYAFEFRGTSGEPEQRMLQAENGKYQRVQIKGTMFKGDFVDYSEKLSYEFDLTPYEFDMFDETLYQLFTSPTTHLPKFTFLFRHLDSEEARLENDVPGFIIIWGRTIVIRQMNQKVRKTICNDYTEVKDLINIYFPNLDQHEVNSAISYCSKFDVIPYMY